MASGPPPGIDLSADRQWHIIGPVIALMALATTAVVVRICMRITTKLPLKIDDYLIIAALVVSYGTGALSIIMTFSGVGRHIWSPEVDLKTVLKELWAYEYLYGFAVPLTKMSIIMFYHRIFPVAGTIYALYFCAFVTIGWWIAVLVTNCVQCSPHSFFWDQYLDPHAVGTCINTYQYFLGNAIASVVTDFIILTVPIPIVWNLQMPRAQKLAVTGILLLGTFVCVGGIVRTYFISLLNTSPDVTWLISEPVVWSCVEPCIGIVSACLPTMGPILRRISPSRIYGSARTPRGSTMSYGLRNRHHRLDSSRSRRHFRSADKDSFRPTEDEVELTVGARASHLDTLEAAGVPNVPYTIAVHHDIEWSSSREASTR